MGQVDGTAISGGAYYFSAAFAVWIIAPPLFALITALGLRIIRRRRARDHAGHRRATATIALGSAILAAEGAVWLVVGILHGVPSVFATLATVLVVLMLILDVRLSALALRDRPNAHP